MSNCSAGGGNESWHAVEKAIALSNCSSEDIMYETVLGIALAVPPWEALLTAIVLGQYAEIIFL